MTGDRWTFLVMRGQDDPVQQYSLSLRSLRLTAGAGAIAFVMVVASAVMRPQPNSWARLAANHSAASPAQNLRNKPVSI